jgi:competence protein ComEA
MDSKKVILIIGFVFFIGLICVWINKASFNSVVLSGSEEKSKEERDIKSVSKPKVLVHVSGAIWHPGLYEVDMGTRHIDILKEAGGLLPSADTSKLNFAAKARDGQRLYVPFLIQDKKGGRKNKN